MKVLKLNKGIEEGLKDLLYTILKEGKADVVLTLMENKNGEPFYAFISSPEKIKESAPLSPFMPCQAGKILSRFTCRGKSPEKIVAVMRPCEIHAFIELVKREQGDIANIVFISTICFGVYPIKLIKNGNLREKKEEYFKLISEGKLPLDIRPTCRACQNILPHFADMIVNPASSFCEIFLKSEKGEKLAEGMGEIEEKEIEISELKALRETERERLKKKYGFDKMKFEDVIKLFGRCLNCHSSVSYTHLTLPTTERV